MVCRSILEFFYISRRDDKSFTQQGGYIEHVVFVLVKRQSTTSLICSMVEYLAVALQENGFGAITKPLSELSEASTFLIQAQNWDPLD